MSALDLSGCKGYLAAQSVRSRQHAPPQLPAITLSREAGTGARVIADLVADRFNARKPPSECPWTVFDKKLVKEVFEDHGLTGQFRQSMPEDTTFELKDAVEELLGLHPSEWTLVQYSTKTILRLARAGNAIIVGRGSNVITARMKHVLHVRLVAPESQRISQAAKVNGLSREEATAYVRKTDRARKRFVARHFDARIDDPLQYHLTINTGRMTFDEAAGVIVEAMHALKRTAKP